MTERKDIPDREQVARLLRMLIGPEEEFDDASAEMVLELHGVEPAELDEEMRAWLEREVAERRGKGEEVPQAMLDALANPPSKTETRDEETEDLNVWLTNLLGGTSPNNLEGQTSPSHLQAFRSRNMESLSEEDRQILEELSAELRSDMAEEE